MRVAIVAENFLPKIDGSTITLAHLLQHLSASNIRALLLGPETGMSTYAGAHLRRPPAPLLPPARPLRLLGRPPDDDDVLSVGCLSLEKNLGLDVDAYAALVASLASLSDAPLIFVGPNAVTRCSPVRYDHSDLRAHQHEHESECGLRPAAIALHTVTRRGTGVRRALITISEEQENVRGICARHTNTSTSTSSERTARGAESWPSLARDRQSSGGVRRSPHPARCPVSPPPRAAPSLSRFLPAQARIDSAHADTSPQIN
ncbi:hypothetical protein B0H12DRAFT_1233270 [Mycena haematopus]|nr:hypothetical protein B0H12DRAFT_1233270 [Mycena haematopus]